MKTAEVTKEIILNAKQRNLIAISEDLSTITYLNQNISRNYNNPEEKIQAEVFCELVLKYNYPVEQVKQYVKVTVGSDVKEADIIVYNDKECKKPYRCLGPSRPCRFQFGMRLSCTLRTSSG